MLHNKVGEQKCYNQFGRFSLVFLLGFSFLEAQTYSEYKQAQESSFQKYKDENDAKFHSYLQSEWEAYTAQIPSYLYQKPKPKKIPSLTPKVAPAIGPQITIEIPSKKERPLPKESVVAGANVSMDFYGTSLEFYVPHAINNAKFTPQTQEGISNFFDSVTRSEYTNLLGAIKQIAQERNLNDWGIYQLVMKLSQQLYAREDEAKLLSWFLFNKLGYAVKVGISNGHIVLMHYAQKTIYSTLIYTIDAKRYFVLLGDAKKDLGEVYTYEKDYPHANKPLDLSLFTLPNLSENLKSKTLSFEEYAQAYSLSYEYNQNLIDFMASYPQAEYEIYFNAPLEPRSFKAVATALKKYVDGKKTSEAMNFVLHFVQNAFKYRVDDEQFGKEKVMFAQETLFYDSSDCEDRAVLFAYLVKELFHVGVVGVKYKDHMATALYLPMQGDGVKAGSKKLVIADPTYINASIGESMSKYKSIKPEQFIVVGNSAK